MTFASLLPSFTQGEFIESFTPNAWMDQFGEMSKSGPLVNSYSNKESPTMVIPGLCVCVSDEFGVNVSVAICSEYKLGLCSAVTENLLLWLIQLSV